MVANIGTHTKVCMECEYQWPNKHHYHRWPVQLRFKWRVTSPWSRPSLRVSKWGVEAQTRPDGTRQFKRCIWWWRFGIILGPKHKGYVPPKQELHCPKCGVSFFSQKKVA